MLYARSVGRQNVSRTRTAVNSKSYGHSIGRKVEVSVDEDVVVDAVKLQDASVFTVEAPCGTAEERALDAFSTKLPGGVAGAFVERSPADEGRVNILGRACPNQAQHQDKS